MDVLALAKINELKKSGGVGYTEQNKTMLSWDGDTSNALDLTSILGAPIVKLSDKYLDFNGITAVTIKTNKLIGNEKRTILKENLEGFTVENAGLAVVAFSFGAVPFSLVGIPSGVNTSEIVGVDIAEGTYLAIREDIFEISEVYFDFGEKVHTIDPKYLPIGAFDVYFDMQGVMSGSNLYIYKTNETGDTTQRVTAEELHKALTDNKTIRAIMVQPSAPEGTTAVFTPVSVSVMPSMGAIGILISPADDGLVSLYTAEYNA